MALSKAGNSANKTCAFVFIFYRHTHWFHECSRHLCYSFFTHSKKTIVTSFESSSVGIVISMHFRFFFHPMIIIFNARLVRLSSYHSGFTSWHNDTVGVFPFSVYLCSNTITTNFLQLELLSGRSYFKFTNIHFKMTK